MQRQIAPDTGGGAGITLAPGSNGAEGSILLHNPDSIPLRFRRLRSGRACLICHSRKVRCDAASHGVPCTNCAAFSFDCKMPRKRQRRTADEPSDPTRKETETPASNNLAQEAAELTLPPQGETVATAEPSGGAHLTQSAEQLDGIDIYAQFIKSEPIETPIKEPGRVAYVAELSNMSVLVHGYNSPSSIVHYPGDIVAPNGLDESELDILRRRGALTLPPKDLCDDLVKVYFKWVAPMVPIINRKRFMEQYRDPENPPSLLLLQAICLAGSRACMNDQLIDSHGSKMPAIIAIYKRVRALYEAHYEDDRVTIVQSLILISMFWERTGMAAKNSFYWTGLAISIAHGFGMHRNAEASSLSKADKRLWKRIWWTLFTRDRSAAVAFGRPVLINMEDSDVEMVSEDDFLDDDNTQFANSRTNRLQVQFFIQYVKLCQVMDLIFLQNYSIAPRTQQQKAMDLTECVMKLSDWLQNCPEELRWERVDHNFWSAQLSSMYHTTNCLLHRAHMTAEPERNEVSNEYGSNFSAYQLRSPVFQCARAITHISESLLDHNELRYAHPFLIYSLSTVLIVYVYEMYIAPSTIDDAVPKRIRICMDAIERLSEIWIAAQTVFVVYETVLRDNGFENCLTNNAKETDPNDGQSLDPKSDEAAKAEIERQARLDSATSYGEHLEPKDIELTPSILLHMLASPNPCDVASKPGKKDAPTEADSSNTKLEWEHSHDKSSRYGGRPHFGTREAQAAPRLLKDKPLQAFRGDDSPKFPMPEFPPAEARCDSSGHAGTRLQTPTSQDSLGQGLHLLQDGFCAKTLDTQVGYFPPDEGCPQYNTPTDESKAATGELSSLLDNNGSTQPPAPVQFGVGEWLHEFDFSNF